MLGIVIGFGIWGLPLRNEKAKTANLQNALITAETELAKEQAKTAKFDEILAEKDAALAALKQRGNSGNIDAGELNAKNRHIASLEKALGQ